MEKIIECVPNISEGRDASVVLRCVEAVSSVKGVRLLDFSSDCDHNRSVITYLGTPEAVEEAAVRLVRAAAGLIDLRRHSGAHPRVGAVDVFPFVAVKGVAEDELVALTKKTARRIYAETGVPIYLYEKSASSPQRKNLADIRRGGFESLSEKTAGDNFPPDVGEGFHHSAGVTVLGARDYLIAYNIELDTDDLSVAQSIARIIRASSGGLDGVKAIGVLLSSKNTAQVSVNITDFRKAPLYRVVELVKIEACRYGVSVRATELIGLIPMRALADSASYYLGIKNFDFDKCVIENYLL